MTIKIYEEYLEINREKLLFPASINEITNIIAEKPRVFETTSFGYKRIVYVFDNSGIYFYTVTKVELKAQKIYKDGEHNITTLGVCFGKRFLYNENEKAYQSEKYFNGNVFVVDKNFGEKSIEYFYDEVSTYHKQKDFRISWPYEKPFVKNSVKTGCVDIYIHKERESSNSLKDYSIKKSKEDILEFDNLNFKLAVMEVLMYEKELLKPIFDIYEFCDYYSSKKVIDPDEEGYSPIKEALNWFKRYPIKKELAKEVTEIYMDGGNEIYMNIAPMWSGEDNVFDINKISDKELSEFINLKKITLMSGDFDKLKKQLNEKAIEAELL